MHLDSLVPVRALPDRLDRPVERETHARARAARATAAALGPLAIGEPVRGTAEERVEARLARALELEPRARSRMAEGPPRRHADPHHAGNGPPSRVRGRHGLARHLALLRAAAGSEDGAQERRQPSAARH